MRYGGTYFHVVLRCIRYSIILLLYFTLQLCFFPEIPIFGTVPVLMPVFCAAIALSEGPNIGGGFGLAAGILFDLALGNPPIGYTLLLTIAGLVIGYLGERLLVRNLLTLLIFSLATLCFCSLFQVLNYTVIKGADFSSVLRVTGEQIFWSMLFALPLWPVVRRAAARGHG